MGPVGYTETAFLSGTDIRYFSPLAEVPFCGHATIATAVALAERDGPGEVVLGTASGPVPVRTAREWTTIQLVWRESETHFHSRNPFPPGGVVEDPATGAAGAALGAYLRDLELVPLPATLTIAQGEDLGRPGQLIVDIRADRAEVEVTGTAVAIT